ncbi:MAG TPA: hypothetical protein VGL77_14330 [Armatimonadota bacterium]|jgi:preprotein translocase subunit SecD
MLTPFIVFVVLLVMGRDELDTGWIWGLLGFCALALVMVIFRIYPIAFFVPVVLIDIFLVLKVFGSDITIR